jgi:AcrR family transcriptional regulator
VSQQCHNAAVGTPVAGAAPPSTLDPALLAARSAIVDLGLRRTTLAEVARRAGVSRMTLYRQYGDLDAIVSALLTAEFTGLFADIAAQTAALPTARDRLVAASAAVVAGIAGHPLYQRVLDVDPELLLPLVVDRLGSTQRIGREIVEDLVRQGQRDGSIRPVEPALAGAVVVVTLQSFVFSARVMAPLGADVAAEIRRLVEGYLRAPAGAGADR